MNHLKIRQSLVWLKFVVQPVIAIATIIAFAFVFGYAQKQGFFTSADSVTDTAEDDTEYVCPMLCVPPSREPGRCPVCGMNLQARKVAGDSKDIYGLRIDPASRRLSNIQTVAAATMPLFKKIKALGRIGQDETSEATISAYVDGRLEKLLVDFTGAKVKKGDELAVLYSPDLYSAQVAMLESRQAMESSTSARQRTNDSNRRLYESARQRLIEFGLPESQVDAIESSGKADSRIKIVSPISGTVIEKMADEGQYVKTGTPIFKVVDLSQVWLMLELFPEDARLIRYGQEVSVTLQSQSGREFLGRVAFVDPQVNLKTQTIPVRVVISNDAGLIRIGEYAQAVVRVDVSSGGEVMEQMYDPGLAGKWISPKHPHIVSDQPGTCPLSGQALVPATQFGFVSYQPEQQGSVVVPRSAVLIAGDESVAYVETEPGRFEFRQVKVGPIVGDQIAVVAGIKPGEMVVAKAPFTLDAAFNMAGKPSLIDPKKAIPKDESKTTTGTPAQLIAIKTALSQLSNGDRDLAEKQKICPVTNFALGSMGIPIKVDVNRRNVFLCCEGCRDRLVNDPTKYFAILDGQAEKELSPTEAADIARALAPLSPEDRKLVEAQGFCPVGDSRLGSMGTPGKVEVNGRIVFICCEGCREPLIKDPDTYLAKLEQQQKNKGTLPTVELDPGQLPQMELPQMDPPK